MTNEQRLERETSVALLLAALAHTGHVRDFGPDKGKSYFKTHLVRVAATVGLSARPAAALHDALECTHIGVDQMARAGISELTRLAILLLERDPDDSYATYIGNIAVATGPEGRIAREVKLADLNDNLSTLPAKHPLRLRYVVAIARIARAMLPEGVEE